MEKGSYTKWDYKFQWTEKHVSPPDLNPLGHTYDELGAAVLERLQEIWKNNTVAEEKRPKLDLYMLLCKNHDKDPVLGKFWDELHTVPDWVDWEQLARGQEFFYRYAVANLTGFALQGFVGENSAATGVVEVLVRTGGFSTKVLLHRLMETFQWLLQVTHSLSSIQPHGEGHASTVRVRLLHASVRQRIMKLVQSRPEYFNVEKYGVPVNTLDSIHSVTTFCCNPMWLQLPKMGVVPSQQEVDDYIALFRYIAYLLATPPEYFETSDKAKAVMESMYLHELEPTQTSKVVGYNFVKCLEDLPPMNISKQFIEAGSRWFNGDELCDALDLGRPGWYHYTLMIGLRWLVMTLAFFQRSIPSFDRYMVTYFRDMLYRVIILTGLGKPTAFDFKYVPQLGKSTERESPSQQTSSKLKRPAEYFLFAAFLIGASTIAVMLILSLGAVTLATKAPGTWRNAERLNSVYYDTTANIRER